MATALQHDTLLIDEYLPDFAFTRVEHRLVDAAAGEAYEAVRSLDLLTVHSPITDAAMFVRTLPERLGRLLGADPAPTPEPASMRLSDLFDSTPTDEPGLEGWVALAEERGRELVFGAVCKPWMADIEWRTVPSFEFAGFAEPGWAKIAASVSSRAHGGGRSILTYEARTALTDEESRRRFARYWTIVDPFVGVIMRSMLSTVAERLPDSEDRQHGEPIRSA